MIRLSCWKQSRTWFPFNIVYGFSLHDLWRLVIWRYYNLFLNVIYYEKFMKHYFVSKFLLLKKLFGNYLAILFWNLLKIYVGEELKGYWENYSLQLGECGWHLLNSDRRVFGASVCVWESSYTSCWVFRRRDLINEDCLFGLTFVLTISEFIIYLYL